MVRRRLPRHSGERGAALFVVVLVLTLLTAVGLFAAQSATLVDQASGYSRQSAQTAYLAELGVQAATSEFGSGAASLYRHHMITANDTCRSNQGVAGTPPCLVFRKNDFVTPAGVSLLDPATMAGPDFVVEITDPGPTGAPVAGMDVGGTGNPFGYMKVTATTIAQVRPGDSATCVEGLTSVTAQQMMRAHLIVGPVDL